MKFLHWKQDFYFGNKIFRQKHNFDTRNKVFRLERRFLNWKSDFQIGNMIFNLETFLVKKIISLALLGNCNTIRKLVVLINQSSYLNYSVNNSFNRALKKHQYEIKSRRLRSQILIFLYFQFYFQRKSRFNSRRQPFRKIIIVEEELDGNDRDDIGNLEDLLRLVLINEECWNPKVVVVGGELAKNINQKKKPDVFYKPVDVHSVTNAIYESISSISIWNIVNQLGNMIFLVDWL